MRKRSAALFAAPSALLLIVGLNLFPIAISIRNCTVGSPGWGDCPYWSWVFVTITLPVGSIVGIVAFIVMMRSLTKIPASKSNRLSFISFLLGLIVLIAVSAFYILFANSKDTTFLPETIDFATIVTLIPATLAAAIGLIALYRLRRKIADKRTRGYAYAGLAVSVALLASIVQFYFHAHADTDFARVYYLMGNRSTSYREALDYYSVALEYDPAYRDVFASRASLHKSNGEYEHYAEDLKTLLSFDPDSAHLFDRIAWTLAYHLETDYEQALAYSLQAVQCDSCSDYAKSKYYATLGLVYQKTGELEAALHNYGVALVLDPENSLAYLGRGDAYLALGDVDAALADYRTCQSLGPPDGEEDYVEKMIAELQDR